ncbi:hypothetical protein ACIWO4_07635 [Avibacterium paragallinarum]|uniref:hypothetical protein n=1 Tax=Avibacterium paragallinarum TaxID=728 RepID=UPI003986E169
MIADDTVNLRISRRGIFASLRSSVSVYMALLVFLAIGQKAGYLKKAKLGIKISSTLFINKDKLRPVLIFISSV